ncbi:MAG: adenylate/guanylate cyclase domain-containing protein, partial [Acidobacteria bacterium]|nr:adenylate/guanylate cyclase domain-containing protein [Acidobacteriota bacterium]
ALDPCLSGEACRGLVQSEMGLIQWVGRPVFDADFLIGIVIVGQKLDQQNLQRIAFLADVHLVTAYGANDRMGSHPEDADLWVDLFSRAGIAGELQEVEASNGTFLTQKYEASDFFPTYWVYKSLDSEMASVNQVQTRLLGLGVILLVLGLVFSHFVARAVSKPILELKSAAEAVGRLDYSVQTHISSQDEFQELGQAFNRMVQGLAEKERIRGVMDKVVSREVAEELLAGEVHLGGEERVASVLFSDLRGFTSLSEGMAPPKLLDLLNAYFTEISSCVEARHGLIDKYIGDAMMALFGVPIARENHAQLAVESALEMIRKLGPFNQRHFPSGSGLAMGIGINSGRVVAGNMGSEHRLNYTVIGDEVNLASRLEGLTKYYRVPLLISGATAEQIEPVHFSLRFLDRVRVKGKQDAISLFEVVDGPMDPMKKQRYQEAWTAMMAQQFGPAMGLFEELVAKYEDGPAQTLMERCRIYLEKPELYVQQYQQGGFGFESK